MLTVHLAKKKRYGKLWDQILISSSFGTPNRINLEQMMNVKTDQKEALLSREVSLWDYNYKVNFPFLTFFLDFPLYISVNIGLYTYVYTHI